MDAFDDLHREAPRGGVVQEAHEDLRRGGLADRRERGGALTAGHVRETHLGFAALKKRGGKKTIKVKKKKKKIR